MANPLAQLVELLLDRFRCCLALRDLRTPGVHEQKPPLSQVLLDLFQRIRSVILQFVEIDNQGTVRSGILVRLERALFDCLEALIDRRRLQRALITKLRIGKQVTSVSFRSLPDFFGRRQRTVYGNHPANGVHLGPADGCREPDTARARRDARQSR